MVRLLAPYGLLLLVVVASGCDASVVEGLGNSEGAMTGPDSGTTPVPEEPAPTPDASPYEGLALEVSEVTVQTGKTYPLEMQGATVGQYRFMDRDYKFTQLPDSLAGIPFLKTSNTDANSEGSAHIEFTVNKPVRIYIAHDDRKPIKPAWLLASYTDTGEELHDDDDNSRGFSIYSAPFDAGRITLGGNRRPGEEERSMYTVFIEDLP